MPQLSVLIPIRDAQATIDQALGSISAQTFRDWEAILVDDGSRDDTRRLLRAWVRRDPRMRMVRHTEPRGIAESLQHALSLASAPLLARMDADDVSLPRRFERQAARLAEGDVAAVGCRIRYFPDEAVAGGARRYETWLNSLTTPEEHDRDIFVECPLAHPTLMARADAVREVGGYRDPGWPEDYDLLLRLWTAGYRMAKVPELLLLWREGPERSSRVQPEYSPDAFLHCKAHYLTRTHLAQGRKALIFGAGPVGKSLARVLQAEGVPLAAFVDIDPRKVGHRVHGVPVLGHPEALPLRGEAYGLVALGQPGQREVLRRILLAAGWKEGSDFRCVA